MSLNQLLWADGINLRRVIERASYLAAGTLLITTFLILPDPPRTYLVMGWLVTLICLAVYYLFTSIPEDDDLDEPEPSGAPVENSN